MKILIIGDFPVKKTDRIGGVEASILSLISGITYQNEFKYVFVSIRDDNNEDNVQIHGNIKIYQFKKKYKTKIIDILFNGRKIIKYIVEREKPILVHFIGSGPTLLYLTKKIKKNTIVTQHGIIEEEYKYQDQLRNKIIFFLKGKLDNYLLSKIKYKIFISNFLYRTSNNNELKKYAIIPNPVHADFYKKPPLVESDDSIIIIGNISRLKNQLLGVKIINNLKDFGYNKYKLKIIGYIKDKKYYENIKHYIKKNKIEDKVEFLGGIKHEKIKEEITKSKIVLITSLQEHLPMVVAETMALGKIILAPNIGAISEMIIDGSNGFLYKKGMEKDLLEKLLMIITHNNLEEIQKNAREYAIKNYHPNIIIKKLKDFYIEVIKNNRKKIAVIGLKGLPAFGGAATVGENIINQLNDKFNFTVYSLSTHADSTVKTLKYKQIIFKEKRVSGIATFKYYIKSLLHALFCGKYDLIHLHHAESGFITPFLRFKYNTIVTFHGIFNKNDPKFSNMVNKFFKISERCNMFFSNHVISVSKVDQINLIKKYKRNVIYIPNGVNLDLANLQRPIKFNYEFLFVAARIYQIKGLHLLLKALDEFNIEGKVLVIGDLNQDESYKKYIKKLSKNLEIEFLPLIKNKNLLFNYSLQCKFYIFPSIFEAMSMSLLEMVALKIPAIVSDIDANKFIFNEEEVLFFNRGDYKDLAGKIIFAKKNPNILEKKAKKAFDKVINKYSWQKISEHYSNLYYDSFN